MLTKTNVSVDVLNRIRESASINYQTAVPIATADAGIIREIGSIIIDSPNLQNEFLNALINRIGKVFIKSRLFKSPLEVFLKGELSYGESVEEIFVNLCEAHQYDIDANAGAVFSKEPNDVRSAFHVCNSEVYYKSSVGRRELEKAFLSSEGVADIAGMIINRMYVSASYDEFLVMKYLIAKAALNGTMAIMPVDAVINETTAKGLIKSVKKVSNDFEILSTDFNTSGVYNSSDKDNQYLIIDNENDANLTVDCLAYMFGPQYADNNAKKIRIDGFDKLDFARLNKVLGVEVTPFTDDEISALGNIEAVLLDWAWFQIYYKLIETRYIENPASLMENTWLHLWKIYSQSPFENACIFASGTNGVQTIDITGDAPVVTHGVAGSAQINVNVTISGLTPMGGARVIYSVETSEGATGTASIDENGLLTWDDDFTAADTITVTVTSAVKPSVTDSLTITVA